MKKTFTALLFILFILPVTASAACRSYMIGENGDGDVINTYRSGWLIFSCSKAFKKCNRDLHHAQENSICVMNREFRWKMVKDLAHDIDKKSKLLHRDLENMLTTTGTDRELQIIIDNVHRLSKSADELHETVETYRSRSNDTSSIYHQLKDDLKIVRHNLNGLNLPSPSQILFDEIKYLFKELRLFY